MRLYVSGHSTQRNGFETFVPAGMTVSMYADNGFMLPDSEALAILRTGKGEVRYHRGPGEVVINYRLTELDGLELARETAVKGLKQSDGSEFPGHVKVVGSELPAPILLCTTPYDCDPKTQVHTCDGLLGSLGKGYDELHLVACRGDSEKFTPYARDKAHEAKVNTFLALDAPERAAAWAKMSEPDRAELISTNGMLRWFEATAIESYAAGRPNSTFARHRAFLALPSDIRELLEGNSDDPFVIEVMEKVDAERDDFDELSDLAGAGTYTLPAWQELHPDAQQDAAAIDSSQNHKYGPIAKWLLATPGATLDGRTATDQERRKHNEGILAGIVIQYLEQNFADEVPLSCVVFENAVLLGSDPSWLPVALGLKHKGGELLNPDPDPMFVYNPAKETPPTFTFESTSTHLADELRAIAAGTNAYVIKFA